MNTPDPFAQLLFLTRAPFSASRKMRHDVRAFAAPQGMEEAAALTPGVQAKSAGFREGGSDMYTPLQKP